MPMNNNGIDSDTSPSQSTTDVILGNSSVNLLPVRGTPFTLFNMRRREHGAPPNQNMSHMLPSSPPTRPIRPFDCAIDPSKVHQVQPIQRSSTDRLNPLGGMFGATNANAMERNTAGCDNLVGSWSSVMRNLRRPMLQNPEMRRQDDHSISAPSQPVKHSTDYKLGPTPKADVVIIDCDNTEKMSRPEDPSEEDLPQRYRSNYYNYSESERKRHRSRSPDILSHHDSKRSRYRSGSPDRYGNRRRSPYRSRHHRSRSRDRSRYHRTRYPDRYAHRSRSSDRHTHRSKSRDRMRHHSRSPQQSRHRSKSPHHNRHQTPRDPKCSSTERYSKRSPESEQSPTQSDRKSPEKADSSHADSFHAHRHSNSSRRSRSNSVENSESHQKGRLSRLARNRSSSRGRSKARDRGSHRSSSRSHGGHRSSRHYDSPERHARHHSRSHRHHRDYDSRLHRGSHSYRDRDRHHHRTLSPESSGQSRSQDEICAFKSPSELLQAKKASSDALKLQDITDPNYIIPMNFLGGLRDLINMTQQSTDLNDPKSKAIQSVCELAATKVEELCSQNIEQMEQESAIKMKNEILQDLLKLNDDVLSIDDTDDVDVVSAKEMKKLENNDDEKSVGEKLDIGKELEVLSKLPVIENVNAAKARAHKSGSNDPEIDDSMEVCSVDSTDIIVGDVNLPQRDAQIPSETVQRTVADKNVSDKKTVDHRKLKDSDKLRDSRYGSKLQINKNVDKSRDVDKVRKKKHAADSKVSEKTDGQDMGKRNEKKIKNENIRVTKKSEDNFTRVKERLDKPDSSSRKHKSKDKKSGDTEKVTLKVLQEKGTTHKSDKSAHHSQITKMGIAKDTKLDDRVQSVNTEVGVEKPGVTIHPTCERKLCVEKLLNDHCEEVSLSDIYLIKKYIRRRKKSLSDRKTFNKKQLLPIVVVDKLNVDEKSNGEEKDKKLQFVEKDMGENIQADEENPLEEENTKESSTYSCDRCNSDSHNLIDCMKKANETPRHKLVPLSVQTSPEFMKQMLTESSMKLSNMSIRNTTNSFRKPSTIAAQLVPISKPAPLSLSQKFKRSFLKKSKRSPVAYPKSPKKHLHMKSPLERSEEQAEKSKDRVNDWTVHNWGDRPQRRRGTIRGGGDSADETTKEQVVPQKGKVATNYSDWKRQKGSYAASLGGKDKHQDSHVSAVATQVNEKVRNSIQTDDKVKDTNELSESESVTTLDSGNVPDARYTKQDHSDSDICKTSGESPEESDSKVPKPPEPTLESDTDSKTVDSITKPNMKTNRDPRLAHLISKMERVIHAPVEPEKEKCEIDEAHSNIVCDLDIVIDKPVDEPIIDKKDNSEREEKLTELALKPVALPQIDSSAKAESKMDTSEGEETLSEAAVKPVAVPQSDSSVKVKSKSKVISLSDYLHNVVGKTKAPDNKDNSLHDGKAEDTDEVKDGNLGTDFSDLESKVNTSASDLEVTAATSGTLKPTSVFKFYGETLEDLPNLSGSTKESNTASDNKLEHSDAIVIEDDSDNAQSSNVMSDDVGYPTVLAAHIVSEAPSYSVSAASLVSDMPMDYSSSLVSAMPMDYSSSMLYDIGPMDRNETDTKENSDEDSRSLPDDSVVFNIMPISDQTNTSSTSPTTPKPGYAIEDTTPVSVLETDLVSSESLNKTQVSYQPSNLPIINVAPPQMHGLPQVSSTCSPKNPQVLQLRSPSTLQTVNVLTNIPQRPLVPVVPLPAGMNATTIAQQISSNANRTTILSIGINKPTHHQTMQQTTPTPVNRRISMTARSMLPLQPTPLQPTPPPAKQSATVRHLLSVQRALDKGLAHVEETMIIPEQIELTKKKVHSKKRTPKSDKPHWIRERVDKGLVKQTNKGPDKQPIENVDTCSTSVQESLDVELIKQSNEPPQTNKEPTKQPLDSVNPPPNSVKPPPDNGNPRPDCGNPPPDCGNPPPDSVKPPPDSINSTPDSINPPPDVIKPPPDSINPPPDSINSPPDGIKPPPDGIKPPPDGIKPPPTELPTVTPTDSSSVSTTECKVEDHVSQATLTAEMTSMFTDTMQMISIVNKKDFQAQIKPLMNHMRTHSMTSDERKLQFTKVIEPFLQR